MADIEKSRFADRVAFAGLVQQQHPIAAGAEANSHEPMAALRQCARLLFDFALDDGMISLSRILIAEAARFPDLGEFVFDTCLAPFKTRIIRLFHAAQQTGAIIVGDDDLTFDLLRRLLLGTPVQRMLLGPNACGGQAARDVYFDTAWRLFLRGWPVRQMDDLPAQSR